MMMMVVVAISSHFSRAYYRDKVVKTPARLQA
jgi:hypothetical protein